MSPTKIIIYYYQLVLNKIHKKCGGSDETGALDI